MAGLSVGVGFAVLFLLCVVAIDAAPHVAPKGPPPPPPPVAFGHGPAGPGSSARGPVVDARRPNGGLASGLSSGGSISISKSISISSGGKTQSQSSSGSSASGLRDIFRSVCGLSKYNMASIGVVYMCALFALVSSIAIYAAPSRERRSPQLGLAVAVLAAPAAILAAPAVALGQASYGSPYGPGYGGGYGRGYGGPVGLSPGYGGPGYGSQPAASFSSSKSFSIGGGSAQSSASSGAGGYGK